MFERYTERARRVVFFARYEASQFGSRTIESEHLLLGLIREDRNLTNRFIRDSLSIERIREEIKGRTTIREKVSTAIDLPLSKECQRILAHAAEEAERLAHRHIGTEHLLLGILREESCVAAEVLYGRGLRLEAIREELAHSAPLIGHQWSAPRATLHGETWMVPDANTAKRIAEAIWIPAFGTDAVAQQQPVDAEMVPLQIWRVTAGPFFAFIRKMDGRVIAMGKEESAHV